MSVMTLKGTTTAPSALSMSMVLITNRDFSNCNGLRVLVLVGMCTWIISVDILESEERNAKERKHTPNFSSLLSIYFHVFWKYI